MIHNLTTCSPSQNCQITYICPSWTMWVCMHVFVCIWKCFSSCIYSRDLWFWHLKMWAVKTKPHPISSGSGVQNKGSHWRGKHGRGRAMMLHWCSWYRSLLTIDQFEKTLWGWRSLALNRFEGSWWRIKTSQKMSPCSSSPHHHMVILKKQKYLDNESPVFSVFIYYLH